MYFIVLGKSSTLSNIQSIFGLDPKEANTHQTTAASLSNQACATTLPVGKCFIDLTDIIDQQTLLPKFMIALDDVRSAKKIEEIAVEFYNGFTKRSVACGEVKPKSSVIATSNCPFSTSERLACDVQLLIILMSKN